MNLLARGERGDFEGEAVRGYAARMSASSRRRTGLRLLWAACAAGSAHAAFSLYWALGGRWLLDTVGAEAVALAGERPMAAVALLVTAGAVKAVAAVVPAAVERTGGGLVRRCVRAVSWAGGTLLVVYGSVLAAVAGAVLTGVISPDGPVDRRGLMGHALLWDPLFALWGLLLLAGLWLTRERARQAGELVGQDVGT